MNNLLLAVIILQLAVSSCMGLYTHGRRILMEEDAAMTKREGSGSAVHNVSHYNGGIPSKLMIATAVVSRPCDSSVGNYLALLSLKNKADYARIHGHGLYWSQEQLDPNLPGPWNKIAVLLYLLQNLDRKQYEWVLWVDYDVLLDPATAVPFDSLDGKDLAMWIDEAIFTEPDGFGLNSGAMLVRISDWSINFFKTVEPLGHNWWQDDAKHIKEIKSVVKAFKYGLYEQAAMAYVFFKHPDFRERIQIEQWKQWVFHVMFRDVVKGAVPEGTPIFAVHYAGCQFCDPQWAEGDEKQCIEDFISRDGEFDAYVKSLTQEGHSMKTQEVVSFALNLYNQRDRHVQHHRQLVELPVACQDDDGCLRHFVADGLKMFGNVTHHIMG